MVRCAVVVTPWVATFIGYLHLMYRAAASAYSQIQDQEFESKLVEKTQYEIDQQMIKDRNSEMEFINSELSALTYGAAALHECVGGQRAVRLTCCSGTCSPTLRGMCRRTRSL